MHVVLRAMSCQPCAVSDVPKQAYKARSLMAWSCSQSSQSSQPLSARGFHTADHIAHLCFRKTVEALTSWSSQPVSSLSNPSLARPARHPPVFLLTLRLPQPSAHPHTASSCQPSMSCFSFLVCFLSQYVFFRHQLLAVIIYFHIFYSYLYIYTYTFFINIQFFSNFFLHISCMYRSYF